MKIIGINGSPRNGWNSAALLDSALDGAKAAGAEVVRYELFDLHFTGCLSCFGCKRLESPGYAKCNLKDDLTPVIEEILTSDGLIVAAPIYYLETPGAVRNLYERLLFPANDYSPDCISTYERRVPVGLLYTMNAPDPKFNRYLAERDKEMFDRFLGPTQVLNSVETYQFDDYSKYASSKMDPVARKLRHETVFPEDCRKAYALGERLVSQPGPDLYIKD